MTATNGDPIDGNPFLGPDEQRRLHELIAVPSAHIDALRADPGFQARIARADVLPRLSSWFVADPAHGDEGWVGDPERSGPVGTASACVAWTFRGTYSRKPGTGGPEDARLVAPLNGVRALGQPVAVQGVTFMGVEDVGSDGAAFLLRRHVDWTGLYAQLGLHLNWRAPLEAPGWRGGRTA